MKRKVVKHGSATLTVSLPAKWAKANKINNGDEINVDEDKNFLMISAGETSQTENKKIVDVEKPKRVITRSINNLYRKGIDTIEVHYKDADIINIINANLPFMLGFEIVEQGKNYCVIKNVAKIDEAEFDNMLRRMWLVTLSLAKDSLESIKKQEFESLDSIAELETTQNKYYMFCCRAINIGMKRKFSEPTLMYLLVEGLEDIADDYKYMCKYLSEKKIKLSDKTLKLYKGANEMLEEIYHLYYDFKIEKGKSTIEKRNQLLNEATEMMENSKKYETVIIHKILELIEKIYNTQSPIFGIHHSV
jgi:phosphate uptake regulator